MTFQAVDIIVVTYGNMFSDLKRSMESLYKFTAPPFHVIVVNNASTDETAAYCSTLPDCTLVNLPENMGTVKAFNAGLEKSTAPFVVRMDHDIELTGPWQDELFSCFADAATGMAGPRIVNPDGTVYAALFEWFLKISNLPLCVAVADPLALPRFLRRFVHFGQHGGEKDDDTIFGVTKSVQHVTGAFWMMSRGAFEKIGPPDTDYPDKNGAFEDLDYTLRFVTGGFRIMYNGKVKIIHYCSRPAQSDTTVAKQPPAQNRALFRKKWGIYA